MFWWFPRKFLSRQGLWSPHPSSLPHPPPPQHSRFLALPLSRDFLPWSFCIGCFLFLEWDSLSLSLSWQSPAELFKTCDTLHYKEQVGTEERDNWKLWESSPKIIVTWGETQAGQVAVKQCESVGRGVHGDREAEGCPGRGLTEGGGYFGAELWNVGLGQVSLDGV